MRTVRRRIRAALLALQTGWTILGITLVMLVFMELGLRALFGLKDLVKPLEIPDRRLLAEGYEGATWPIVHYREL
jgi:hypothetical protein